MRYNDGGAFLSGHRADRYERDGDSGSFSFLGTWTPLTIFGHLRVHSF